MVIEFIKPVRYGILLGLLGIIFGILWSFWLVLGHEKIHEDLEKRAVKKQSSFIQLFAPQEAYAHSKKETPVVMEHKQGMEEEPKPHVMGGHDDPVIDLAHRILARGHIHSIGLGFLTIVISMVLAFTSAGDTTKSVASIITGLGGILNPIAWIIMGYRIPAMGLEEADASVRVIAGPAAVLVLSGISVAAFFIVKDIISSAFSEKK